MKSYLWKAFFRTGGKLVMANYPPVANKASKLTS